MKIIKVTILTRSFDTLYDYGKTKRSFWEDLTGLLRGRESEIAVEKRGNLQCSFYYPVSDEKDPVFDITEMIRSLGPDPAGFVISATDLKAADLSRLEEQNTDQIKDRSWFAAAKEQVNAKGAVQTKPAPQAPAAESAEEAAPAPKRPRRPATQGDPGDGGKAKDEASEVSKAGSDLAEEALRISELRSKILEKVRGQRHAVDEVVQTIFECDAFNRVNEERKGPLASFLFTGPSGVGKTFLARTVAKIFHVKPLVVDMSEFSDNLSNGKFNGEHGQPALVTGYVRENPKGIIIFDEIEKAHINTIYLFLQILDSGELTDMKLNKKVSFKDTIIFITTNAGSSLYDDPTVIDLSGVSRKAILEALRSDIKPGTMNEHFFPECITTRFANGHVILFNHLEPYALMQIVQDEIRMRTELIGKSYGVKVKYDPTALAALVLYSTGGTADARTLRGAAKNMIVKELQDVILQTYQSSGKGVNDLKEVEITLHPELCEPEVRDLFAGHEATRVLVFADEQEIDRIRPMLNGDGAAYEFFSDPDQLKRRARGVVDYVLLDPAAGGCAMERMPNDLEDIKAAGNELFHYLREFYPEIPVYFLDARLRGDAAYTSLLAKGGRGVITPDPQDPHGFEEQIRALSFGALVNNSAFRLGRSGKMLSYNCSQYNPDEAHAVISFDKLSLGYAPSSTDSDVITRSDDKNGVNFDNVIGCKAAKAALKEFCRYVKDPRKMIMQGKKMPSGVLLYGPPGTGKTMLAKAMANESGAAFIPTTATSLFGSLVGESEKNVRDLFRRARRYAPAIIFIDEVDAIGRARTGSVSTAHNEDTLNAFIAEMDGFATDERRPVFVLAATNYEISGDGPRVLDAAFVRRFGRKVYVGLPDTEDRLEILKATLARHGIHFGDDHDGFLKNLAERSSGMSGSDLTTVIDLFLRACEDKTPTQKELTDAFDTFRFGEVNELDPADLRQTACHESGHALVTRLLGETPAFLTVVARGNFGGYMEHDRDEKKTCSTYGELMDRVCASLAGRAAEIEVYGKDAGINTGASSDLSHARYVIKLALNDFAMGDKLYTAGTDEDCEKLIQTQFARTVALLHEHRGVLDALTDLLVEKKSLNKAELERFFAENKI